MAKNPGKVFEEDFIKSIPNYCLKERINDMPQAFIESGATTFTPKNPCDFYCFDTQKRILYYFETKTTKSTVITFEDVDSDEKQNRMIHKHQITGLLRYSEYNNVIAGFVFNFREEDGNIQRTYFQDIRDFEKMRKSINKLSLNEFDLIYNGAIKIKGTKKRTRYSWDVDSLLKHIGDSND